MRKYLQRSLLGSLGAVSGTTTYKSLWQPIPSFNSFLIQVIFTGTPVANISLVQSADQFEPGYVDIASYAPVNYDYISGSTVAASSVVLSPSGSYIVTYEVVACDANSIAVQWVNASSTGTITAINFVAKGKQV
jgi:hypothetical protein